MHTRQSTWSRLPAVLRREFAGLHLRLLIVDALVRLLPQLAFPLLRTALYRLAGFSIGRGTLIAGRLHLIGAGPIHRRLRIGANCFINAPFFASLDAGISIGDEVTIGHHTVLVTANHVIGSNWRRGGDLAPRPIEIGKGAWLGACITVLPGATIGPGAVIAAGSLVRSDIPADVLAAGVPARVLRKLGDGPEPTNTLHAADAVGAL